jgi:hypothetical protein
MARGGGAKTFRHPYIYEHIASKFHRSKCRGRTIISLMDGNHEKYIQFENWLVNVSGGSCSLTTDKFRSLTSHNTSIWHLTCHIAEEICHLGASMMSSAPRNFDVPVDDLSRSKCPALRHRESHRVTDLKRGIRESFRKLPLGRPTNWILWLPCYVTWPKSQNEIQESQTPKQMEFASHKSFERIARFWLFHHLFFPTAPSRVLLRITNRSIGLC